MKRLTGLKFAMIALALMLVITGCATGGEKKTTDAGATKDGGGKTITIWTLQQADINIESAQKKAAESFEKQFNAKVEITAFPYVELRDKLLTAVAGSQGPDVLLLDQIWVAQYAAAKYIIPLDDMLAKSEIKADDYFPGAWGAGSYDGKMYAIPFDVGVWGMLYYNKDMFTAAGLDPEKPPVTWDEFMEVGRKLTKDGKYGFANWSGTGDSANCIVDGFVVAGGGHLLDDSGKKVLINEEPGVKALEFWASLNEISPPGTVGKSEEDALTLFTSGQTAMALYGEWGQDTIATRSPNMNYGVANMPMPAGGKSVGTFGGFNMAINAKSKNQDLAWEFIKYSTNYENNKVITMLTPAHQKAAQDYLQEKRKFPDIIFKQLTTATYRPSVPNYPEIADLQLQAMQKAMTGKLTAKEALDEAADKINKLLNK